MDDGDEEAAGSSRGARSRRKRIRIEFCPDSSSDNTTPSEESSSSSEGEEEVVQSNEHPLLLKDKPKHDWFVVEELAKRQLGLSSKHQSSILFQRRCYGSLHAVQRLQMMYIMEDHDGCVNCLNFNRDGSLLASGSDDTKVVVWNWKTGKKLIKFASMHCTNVFQSKFLNMQGDLHIATCARDGQVRLCRVGVQEGLRENRLLATHKAPCRKLAILQEEPHVLMSAGEDGVVMNLDIRESKPQKLLSVKRDGLSVALFSIHGNPLRTQEFCVCGREDSVRVYERRKTVKPLALYNPKSSSKKTNFNNQQITCAIYNHNGSEILASYSNSNIYLFDVNQPPGNFLHVYKGHINATTIKGVNFFGPKSEFIVSGSDCGNVFFWERKTESIVQWMMGDDDGVVNCLEPHPQFPFICTSGFDWDVKVWAPSCNKQPQMKGLAEALCKNELQGYWPICEGVSENQMLWILWRHLRGIQRRSLRHESNSDAAGAASSSSSDSADQAEEEGDDDDDQIGCSAS